MRGGASPEQDFFENLANFTSDYLVVSAKLLYTHTHSKSGVPVAIF